MLLLLNLSIFLLFNKLLNKIRCMQGPNSSKSENVSRGRGDDELARAVSLSLEVGLMF